MRHSVRTVDTRHSAIRLTQTGGRGLPVVLLHGGGAERNVFIHQLESQVAERHQLIAPDLPGHGDSSYAVNPALSYTLPGYADAIASMLEGLSVERAVIFGWSLGGHIGVQLLAQHPERVAGLMLMGAPPIGRGPLAMLRGFHASWDMLLASKENFTPNDVQRYAKLCYGTHTTPDLLDAVRRTDGRARAVFARSLMRGEGADQRHVVEHADVPIAIVNGEHDPLVRLSYFETLDRGHLWDGGAYALPDAGHAAFRDQPGRFNALLLRFASDCEAHTLAAPARLARRA